MQPGRKKKIAPKQPSKPKQPTPPDPNGILDLLDAPETDNGVLAEARSYGAKGCEVLARAAAGKSLDPGRRARAVHLMGLLRCKEVGKLAPKLLRDDVFGVQVAMLYALAASDPELAERTLMPLIGDANAGSLLREHAVHALWPALGVEERRAIAKTLQDGEDERLRQELEPLLLQLDAAREQDPTEPPGDPD